MQALYRKYRPKSFDEVVGQEQVTDILKLAVSSGRTGHGYLLVGPRGVGKTSIARILAYSINDIKYELDSSHIDVIEIDAASNTSVDNIREIIEKAYITPAQAKFKIYIIDEVHMLSKSAFNAFLKLLEEPPKHVIFILATTDEHKIPATIISRTQRFVFRKIDDQAIAKQLRKIANEEKISITDEGLASIAAAATGGLRDAINLLDQLSSLSGKNQPIEQTLINKITGTIDKSTLTKLLDCYHQNNLFEMIETTNALLADNFTSVEIAKQLAQVAKNNLIQDSSNLQLIANLLKVEKSSMPDLELIVALGSGFNVTKLPLQTTALAQNLKQESVETTPTVTKMAEAAPSATDSIETSSAKQPAGATTPASEAPPKPLPATFPKADFLKSIKKNHLAIFGILDKAEIIIQQNELIIKVSNSFNLKRLSDPKHFANLQKTLVDMELGDLNVRMLSANDDNEQKSSQIKSVLDIMGGGEEVNLDE